MIMVGFVHSVPDVWLSVLPAVLYIGPDVFLPLTSALAALGGVLLMFWHRIAGFVARLFGRGKSSAPPDHTSKRG